MRTFIQLMVLSTLMWHCFSVQCPEGCQCADQLNCSGVQLNVTELHISGMDLTDSLATGTTNPFLGLNALRTLSLIDNKITTVTSRFFEQLINLNEVFLDSNSIQKLEPNTFTENHQLYKLHLNNNPLHAIPHLISHSLGWLELQWCNLTKLHHHAFDNMTNLFYLSLDGNRFHKLPQQLFQKLVKLSHFHVRNNMLTKIDANMFSRNLMLEVLHLGNNPLTLPASGPFLVSSSLLILDLSFCDIIHIPVEAFSQLPLLRSLNLKYNNLKHVSFDIISQLNELKVVNLGWNRLISVDIEMLYELQFKNSVYIDLLGNPMQCNCSQMINCYTYTDVCMVKKITLKLPCSIDCEPLPNEFMSESDISDEDQTVIYGPKQEGEGPIKIETAFLAISIGGAIVFLVLLLVFVVTVRACRRRDELPYLDDETDYLPHQTIRSEEK